MHPTECVAQFVGDDEENSADDRDCEEEVGREKGSECCENVGNDGDNLQGENSVSNQIN